MFIELEQPIYWFRVMDNFLLRKFGSKNMKKFALFIIPFFLQEKNISSIMALLDTP
jgi:hypothetical protein